MSTDGNLIPGSQPDPIPATPADPATSPLSWFLQYRRLLIPAAAVLALGAVSAAAVLLLVKPASTVEKMVPASQDVIVVANVDPSVSQKVNLMRALHSFPDTKTDKAIDDKLDEALKDTGFSFTGDIKPWVGSQIAVSARLNVGSAKDSPAALYIASRDDAKAQAVLAKLRASKYTKKLQWKDETYNGITISIGTPSDKSEQPAAYSFVDHVLVLATNSAQIHEIIDTDQGRAPRLVDSSDYRATLAGLPSDRLGYVYINGKSLVGSLKKELATTPALSVALKNRNDVDALQGIGATLSANGDGLLADLLVKLDQSKLTPATREALSHSGRADRVVSWVPKASDAFLAITGLNKAIQSLLDQSGNDTSVKASTDAIGLTGPGGVLAHLTGEAGLEVGFGRTGLPAGAILLGTDDTRGMTAFFGKLLTLAEGASSGFGGVPPSAGHVTTINYRGIVITSWSSPDLAQLGGVTPSYAVLDGMGILASNADEVKAIIDTHKDGATIASDQTYKTAIAGSIASPTSIFYVDVARLVDALRHSQLGSQAGLGSDSKLSANVDPIKAVIVTGASQPDRASERFFIIIR